jgi:hypothetical protein
MYPPAPLQPLFRGALRYAAWFGPPTGRVREDGPAGAFPWTERHLLAVWFDPQFRPAALRTADGEPVAVESPGRWNLEAGPDFLDASLIVGAGRRLRGDVELHVRPSDWAQHGHAADPRYRRVVAHVTYFPGPADGLPAGAVSIGLRDALAANRAFSFQALDLAAYPYAALLDPAPCAAAFAALAPGAQAAVLESAGQERLRRKGERLAEALRARSLPECLYTETMDALGYKQNREPFRVLATRVPLARLQEESGSDPERAYALLCGVGGLLPARAQPDWDADTREFVRRAWDFWWKRQAAWQDAVLPRSAWTLAGQRPANHPLRRLMAAACLFCGPHTLPGTLERLRQVEPAGWLEFLTGALRAAGEGTYWSRRLGLAGAPRPEPVALVGEGRAAAIVTNVLVPLLAAAGETAGLPDDWLTTLPADDENATVRQMAATLLGRDAAAALYRTGLRQQGLLQLFQDFCLARRAGCRDCPLPELLAKA